jgi:hypothetical protein
MLSSHKVGAGNTAIIIKAAHGEASASFFFCEADRNERKVQQETK